MSVMLLLLNQSFLHWQTKADCGRCARPDQVNSELGSRLAFFHEVSNQDRERTLRSCRSSQ